MFVRIAAVGMLVLGVAAVPVRAQHGHGGHARQDTTCTDPHATEESEQAHHEGLHVNDEAMPDHAMSGTLLPDLPMQRSASGTSWQPDATPMEAVHAQTGDWNFMFHGTAFPRFTSQDVFGSGERGDSQFDAPNWFMGMASRPFGKNVVTLRAMLSADAFITGGRGYPLLFQSGETFEGEPLIDRQHPHDLFSELSVSYGRSIGDKAGVFAYFGLPGEPALGPPAFMHRASAAHNPDSPIGHHWQDATHIIFGVAMLGARYGIFKMDGSIFTGREPDEERFGIDRPLFDSYSLRLSANPGERWALQVSRAFLTSPEAISPDEDAWRTTASVLYNVPFRTRGAWSNTLLWGLNQSATGDDESDSHGSLHSLLLESDLDFGKIAVYTRVDWTQKNTHELGLDHHGEANPEGGLFDEHDVFNIGTWTLGAARDVATFGDLRVMIGAQGTLYRVPEDLRPIYGDFPVSAQVYLRLSPIRMLMQHGDQNGMPHMEH